MNPSHDQITERAKKLWQEQGRPADRDDEIWLEAERQLMREEDPEGNKATPAALQARVEAARSLAEQIKDETAAESSVEYLISPPVPREAAIRAALENQDAATTRKAAKNPPAKPKLPGPKVSAAGEQQKKAARAPQPAGKPAPKPKPAATGKPLWKKPHSA